MKSGDRVYRGFTNISVPDFLSNAFEKPRDQRGETSATVKLVILKILKH